MNFSFENLFEELQERAPLFLLVLKTAAFQVNDEAEKWKPAVGVAAAVCLRNRSRNMIALQLLIAIINRHSGFMVIHCKCIFTFLTTVHMLLVDTDNIY